MRTATPNAHDDGDLAAANGNRGVIFESHAARQLDARDRFPLPALFLQHVDAPTAWRTPFAPRLAPIAFAQGQQVIAPLPPQGALPLEAGIPLVERDVRPRRPLYLNASSHSSITALKVPSGCFSASMSR